MENPLPQVSARELVFVLMKRRWSIFFLLLASVIGSFVYLFLIREDIYAVTARVLVKLGREQAPPPTLMWSGPLVVGYRTNEVNSEMEILQATSLVNKVIDDLHLDQPSPPEPPPPGVFAKTKYYSRLANRTVKEFIEEAYIRVGLRERLSLREKVLDTLQKSINVKAAKDSNVFVVVLGTPYRKGATLVLNKLLDEYLIHRQTIYQSKGAEFFRNQADRSMEELRAADKQLQDFENRENISALTKQEETLVEQINRDQAFVREARILRNESAHKVRQLEIQLKSSDPNFAAVGDFPRDSFQQNMLNQLADLEREREKLRLTELETGEKVVNNRQQFRVLSVMLEANLRSGLAEREANLAARSKSLGEMENELRSRHGKVSEWISLKRKAVDLEGSYTAYRKKMSENKVDFEMQNASLGNVVIIDRPVDPIMPVGLRKTTLLGIIMLTALFVALAWVSIAEFLDQSVYSASQATRALGAPVLAELPWWEGSQNG